METNTSTDPTIEGLMADFDFAIDDRGNVVDTPPVEGADPKPEGGLESEAVEGAEGSEGSEGGDPKPAEGSEGSEGAEGAEGGEEGKEKKDKKDPEPVAPTGKSDSFYAGLAKKYLEKGRWSKDLAIEDEDGNQIPIEEVKDLNEETFFQIEEAIRAEEAEKLKEEYIPVKDLDERKKNLLEIITQGGDLTEVFQTPQQVEQYLNPFAKLDLDDEATQERVYMNALMQYSNLDQKSAAVLVKQAKEDFTLDEKAKKFVADYTKQFDAHVDKKKAEILERKQEEKKQLAEFKKALTAQYKEFGLKDSLARTLTSAAVTQTDGGFEIDAVYDEKMQDPTEAAELVLFLKDKEAYLEMKMKETRVTEQKKTRKIVKMIPNKKSAQTTGSGEQSGIAGVEEFDFEVNVPK